ncbi:MAG: DUF86 domain-containing protein [Deltaproteobacteria bacterium]|nr:DUF86 domain-containing protein [Deltaproteobacteria bacterium]
MLEAARKIDRYIKGLAFEDFVEDEKAFDAVIRQLTIMGEASSHIPEEITALSPEIPWSSIRGMRNVIVHDYLSVNMRIVWKTVTKDLPDLCFQLEALQSRIARKDYGL